MHSRFVDPSPFLKLASMQAGVVASVTGPLQTEEAPGFISNAEGVFLMTNPTGPYTLLLWNYVSTTIMGMVC